MEFEGQVRHHSNITWGGKGYSTDFKRLQEGDRVVKRLMIAFNIIREMRIGRKSIKVIIIVAKGFSFDENERVSVEV